VKVADHDFYDADGPVAIPYGIYDLGTNTGWVNVGTDHDTGTFAAASIRSWWLTDGIAGYPDARRLLITADSGGSNSATNKAFKAGLAALAAETGLTITVCHFPPGASKWNRIEHRLFCHISRNWRGRPLTDYQTVLNLIGATTTASGLTVSARMDDGDYPLGVTVTDRELAALPITGDRFHPEWNHTFAPQPPAEVPHRDIKHHITPPDLSWLRRPEILGMDDTAWQGLLAAVTAAAGRRRHIEPRLLAAIAYHRNRLTHAQIGELLHTDRPSAGAHIRDFTKLIEQAGGTIPAPAPHPVRTLSELWHLAGGPTPPTSNNGS
jgi:Rhodopirellula transposase DDE domain